MKVSVQTVLAPLISNVLYLGIFGGMLSTRQAALGGIDYLHFLVPGLVTMGAIFAAFQNPAFSIISQKFQNTIQDLNSYTISNLEKSMAFILGGTFRGMLVGLLTYGATVIFVGWKMEYPLRFLLALAATSFFFASVGLICGLLLDNFEKMNFVLSIVITPMAYLGGVFFEITRLPGLLPVIRFFNPIYPLVNITRYAYLGVFEGDVRQHAVLSLALMAGAFLTAVLLFKKGYGIKTL
jgi:ABC-2 type transport system permease protein